MRIAVMVDGERGLGARDWLALATLMDSFGFDALLRSDHYASGPGERLDCLDSWVACAAAAVTTERIGVGTLVSPVTFRHPAVLAKTAASVAALSGGRRIDVGVGIGWNEYEHAAAGLAFPPPEVRYRMAREQLAVLRGLWSDCGPFSFDGEFYRIAAADFYPKPSPPPRVVVGKRGRPRSVGLAVEWADEYNIVFATAQRCEQVRGVLDRACAAAGRSTSLELSVMTDFIVGRSRLEVDRRLAAAATHNRFLEEATAETLPEPYLWGSPERLIDLLAAYERSGVDRVILKHPVASDLASIELLATEVLPAFETEAVPL